MQFAALDYLQYGLREMPSAWAAQARGTQPSEVLSVSMARSWLVRRIC